MSEWFGWVVVAFLSAWMVALVSFIFFSLVFRCFQCCDADDVLRRRRRRWRKKATLESLVTKKVLGHTEGISFGCCKMNEDGLGNDIDTDIEIQQTEVIDRNCPICLEPLNIGESVSWSKYLPNCKHTFHTECISTWLERHADCPCCRRCIYTKDILVDKNRCFSLGLNCGRNKRDESLLAQNCEAIRRERGESEYCFEHGLVTPGMLSTYQNGMKQETLDLDKNVSEDEKSSE